LMHVLGWTQSSLFFAPSIFADLLTENIRKNKNMIITSFKIMSSLSNSIQLITSPIFCKYANRKFFSIF
jgi:hypothetical protein